jgi:hypothetical protein
VVLLDWNLKDPAGIPGSPTEVVAAYEESFRFLHGQIKDLVEAILGIQSTDQNLHL